MGGIKNLRLSLNHLLRERPLLTPKECSNPGGPSKIYWALLTTWAFLGAFKNKGDGIKKVTVHSYYWPNWNLVTEGSLCQFGLYWVWGNCVGLEVLGKAKFQLRWLDNLGGNSRVAREGLFQGRH